MLSIFICAKSINAFAVVSSCSSSSAIAVVVAAVSACYLVLDNLPLR